MSKHFEQREAHIDLVLTEIKFKPLKDDRDPSIYDKLGKLHLIFSWKTFNRILTCNVAYHTIFLYIFSQNNQMTFFSLSN